MKLYFAKEFSSYPYGRYENDGKHSGEAFRRLLARKFQEAKENQEKLEVILDDVHALSGSFLDEAFGKFSKELLEKEGIRISKENFDVHGDLPHYEIYAYKIWECINKHYQQQGHVA